MPATHLTCLVRFFGGGFLLLKATVNLHTSNMHGTVDFHITAYLLPFWCQKMCVSLHTHILGVTYVSSQLRQRPAPPFP